MDRKISLFFIGAAIFGLSLFYVYYSSRAAKSHNIYFKTKYRSEGVSPEEVFAASEKAYQLYPKNYFTCIYAGEMAQYNRVKAGKVYPERAEQAKLWCERGVSLNDYSSQLRYLNMRLIEEDSLDEAVKYWEEYVNWDFWRPYNQAVMVELYAKSGDFNKATKHLQWVRGSKHYQDAKKNLYAAWVKEMRQ